MEHAEQTGAARREGADRQEQIAARRKQIPRDYQANYDRAVAGGSLRAAMNAMCLECVYWNRREVRLCTDLACSLWAKRPYQQGERGGKARKEVG